MIADFVAEELYKVLVTILYGVASTFTYDILRILRRCVPHNIVAVSVEDMLYWIALSICTFALLIRINDGGVRFYFLIGAVLGAILYSLTVGKHIVSIISAILRKIPIGILKNIIKSCKIKNIRNKRRHNGKKRKEI